MTTQNVSLSFIFIATGARNKSLVVMDKIIMTQMHTSATIPGPAQVQETSLQKTTPYRDHMWETSPEFSYRYRDARGNK